MIYENTYRIFYGILGSLSSLMSDTKSKLYVADLELIIVQKMEVEYAGSSKFWTRVLSCKNFNTQEAELQHCIVEHKSTLPLLFNF